MSHAMQKLKAKWEGEWREKYDAEQAANAEAEIEASRAIAAHRIAAWAMDGECENDPLLRPTPLSYGPKGPPHHAMRGGENMRERIHARDQAEAQMAEAQRLWEACATEESWEGFSTR